MSRAGKCRLDPMGVIERGTDQSLHPSLLSVSALSAARGIWNCTTGLLFFSFNPAVNGLLIGVQYMKVPFWTSASMLGYCGFETHSEFLIVPTGILYQRILVFFFFFPSGVCRAEPFSGAGGELNAAVWWPCSGKHEQQRVEQLSAGPHPGVPSAGLCAQQDGEDRGAGSQQRRQNRYARWTSSKDL